MDLWRLLEARTTVRRYSDRPVDRPLIEKAVRAALNAPSYSHLWDWGFILLSDPAWRRRIVDALGIVDVTDRAVLERRFGSFPAASKRIYLRALPVQRTMLLSAPEVIVPVYRCKRHEWSPKSPSDLNAHASIWMAIAYLVLSLAEDGLQACTLVPPDTSAVRSLLELPDGWELATLLPVGYPPRTTHRPDHPADPSMFLHVDRFGGFPLPITDESID